MPLLILLGILLVWGAIALYNACSKKSPPYSHEDLDKMLGQMVGKSKKDANRIFKSYKK